jgi:hypothetical protein
MEEKNGKLILLRSTSLCSAPKRENIPVAGSPTAVGLRGIGANFNNRTKVLWSQDYYTD